MRKPLSKKQIERNKKIDRAVITTASLAHVAATAETYRIAFDIAWSAKGIGFGHVTFAVERDGHLRVSTENMGRKFAGSVLKKLLESAEVID